MLIYSTVLNVCSPSVAMNDFRIITRKTAVFSYVAFILNFIDSLNGRENRAHTSVVSIKGFCGLADLGVNSFITPPLH